MMESEGAHKMVNRIIKAIHCITAFLSKVGMYLLLVIMFLTVTDIITRALFSKPILGSYEMTEISLAVFILLGIAYTQQVDGNVNVDILPDGLPVRLKLGLDILVALLSLILFVVIVWKGGVHAANAFHKGLTTDTLRLPAYPFLFFVPLGAGFVCLELLIRVVTLVHDLRRR